MGEKIRRSRQRGVSAWLIRWDWAGDHAAVEQPIIAVLSSRLGTDQVKQFVEWTYAVASYSPAEKLRFMLRPAENPYPARFSGATVDYGDGPKRVTWTGEMYCGDNPWIYARLVRNLRATDDVHLEWEDLPRPGDPGGPWARRSPA